MSLYAGAAEGACCTGTYNFFKILVDFTDIETDTGRGTDTEKETDTATGTAKETKKKNSLLKKTDTETAKGKATATETGTVKEKAAPRRKAVLFVKNRKAAGFGCFHCSGRISDSRQASSASDWAFMRYS